ncbi:hypothetical protein, partial [Xanthomonas euroxanthea]|uniref:hypothetical protein n=1 Tax=Xanthomonas euroxanthea TaxID=2259622 RepID=UPI001ABA6A34
NVTAKNTAQGRTLTSGSASAGSTLRLSQALVARHAPGACAKQGRDSKAEESECHRRTRTGKAQSEQGTDTRTRA